MTGITGLSKYAPAAVETGNGESLLVYYNKDCVSGAPDIPFYSTSPMCANIIYDLNGIDGPNRIGKDMGVITAYFKNNPVVVAPMPITSNASDGSAPSYADDDNNAAGLCKKKNQESRLPDREEAASLYYNNRIFNITPNMIYWTGSIVSPGKYGLAWARGSANASISYNSIGYWGSYIVPYSRSNSAAVRCIKK